ncbi:putative 2OG-Fe(II) oxygenase [Sphingopyxis indica]|uniref:Putative 2OG-Fe(II) oxygenase n=1 Tax=Sphingopyxis indica TaxID=436663 RepID=A0A239KH26_9SPHN|nr:putative 2OG-Fe(II) oxygenase [Sphingopyxis indica]SNT17471.1 Putative 2OG-Fe(II) oxygenase [Sphingopyxis indica]
MGAASLADPDAFFAAGIDLLRGDRPEQLFDRARIAARRHGADARMQQLLGLTARALGQSRVALDAFGRAARLAPADALIAHSHARAALEAGRPAVALFDRAARLAPADGSVLMGRAAAQVAEGLADQAIADLDAVVQKNPLWMDGQRALARLRGQQGLDPAGVVVAALRRLPRQTELHRECIAIHLEARDLDAAQAAVDAAARTVGEAAWLTTVAAHVASERGAVAEADRLFDVLGAPGRIDLAAQRVRHLIRAERPVDAARLIDDWIDRDDERLLWPYRSLAWRMTGDPRWQWLEGDAALVGCHDLAPALGDLGEIADHLRRLHAARAAPLDQSVRGGTQTDGHLLLRDEPIIDRLRSAISAAVAAYVAQLPPPRPGHPTLPIGRAPIRFAGAWSVRLEGEGFHTDHVHSQGWISSALYIALPETSPEGAARHEGWLSLGEARDLVPGLAPLRLIEPRPGRLVLFPSTMWHGTRPFPAGERLTVAFDIARPPQG